MNRWGDPTERPRDLFWPMLILTVWVLVWVGYETMRADELLHEIRVEADR